MRSGYFVASVLMADGKVRKHILFGASEREVRRDAAALGGVLQGLKYREKTWVDREVYTNAFKVGFFKSLIYQIEGGTSPANALVNQIRAEKSGSKRTEMQRALIVLERGGKFSEAIAALPFSDGAISSMMQTAEAGGDMAAALADVVSVIEARGQSWKIVTSAFAWLSVDMSTIVSSVFGIQFYALDWFRNNRPPLADAATAAAYDKDFSQIEVISLVLTTLTIVLIVVSVLSAALLLLGGQKLKRQTEALLLRLPFLRSVFVDGALASGMQLLSRLTSAGVPLSRSLELLASSTQVVAVASYWRAVLTGLDAGAELGRAAAVEGHLTESELSSLDTQRSKDHFIYVTGAIATQRRARAEGALRTLIRIGVGITLAYMAACTGLMLLLLKLQNSGVSGSFEDLMKGGFR